jgi:hypothetical protein
MECPALQIVPVVETLLDVAAFPEDSIAAICFNFWNSLAEGLANAEVEAEEKERRRLVRFPLPVPSSSLLSTSPTFSNGHFSRISVLLLSSLSCCSLPSIWSSFSALSPQHGFRLGSTHV